jgi:hypothetical protein
MPPWLIGSLVGGVICGLFPLISGFRKGRIAAGIGAFLACVAASILLCFILSVFIFNPKLYLGNP